MRLLFYTATITLLLAGGVFAYFAVQKPQIDTSAKVVIAIEPYAASVAEAKTNQILKQQQARLQEQDQATPDPSADRLQQEDEPPVSETANQDKPTQTAALDEGDQIPSEPVKEEQAEAEKPAPVIESQPSPEVYSSIPGASISVFDAPLQNAEPAAPAKEPKQQHVAKTEAPPANDSGIGQDLHNSLASNDLNETAAEPEVNKEASVPQPVEQEVAAIDSAQEDKLLIEDDAPAVPVTEDVSSEAVTEPAPQETQNGNAKPDPDVQVVVATPATETDADPQEEATPVVPKNEEDKQKLRATFNAFVASLKEKERQQQVALVTPPPLPLKRPENIPAPVRTASLNADVGATPRVAILLRGLGRNDKNSEIAVTSLPSAISFGFAPYVGIAQQLARQARERGHEVIIQLPFEPADYPKTNPGPDTILTTSSATVNTSKLRTVLGRFQGYNGVTSYYGGKLLQSSEALRPVLEDIKSRGLIYVSEPDTSQALVRKLAAELGVIYGGADLVIDTYQTNEAIQKNLDELVELARKHGSAIGMAYASRNSIEQLRIWSETVASKGVTLVPVGVLAQTPGAS